MHVEPGHTAGNSAPGSSHAADASLDSSKTAAAADQPDRRESQEQSSQDPQDGLHKLEHGIEAILQAQLSKFERSLASICDVALANLSKKLSSIVRNHDLHGNPVADRETVMAGVEPESVIYGQ